MNTNLESKKRLFPVFMKMVEDQFNKGGKKYAGNTEKEWTDTIMEFDDKFMLATMMKYIGRIKNGDPRSEEDLAKIATYAFLQWIKMFGDKHFPLWEVRTGVYTGESGELYKIPVVDNNVKKIKKTRISK